jgi:hypothetical protein
MWPEKMTLIVELCRLKLMDWVSLRWHCLLTSSFFHHRRHCFSYPIRLGEVLVRTTAQTTDIHRVINLSEKNIIATAAVGERYINVFIIESRKLNRIGSLTCTLDVRAILIQDDDTLLAITVNGTLEILRDFSIGFEPTKKGGITKPPNAKSI